ncbi:protein kinase domain-containing protein [Ditylenchus destructor]|nr:protein kinase domain-containing protein [Ditylenchus destructor]
MNCKLRRSNSLSINDTRIAGLYDLEHTIGKGHFAVVKLARHVFTGEKVAVKVIDKTRLDPVSTSHMMQEVRCMKLVQHPNIIRLYEIIDTQTKLFLILELGDYDMYDYIMKKEFDRGGCKESDAQQYFSQIIKAIDYCHKLHVVHRDLKPENVIFFEKLGMVKLTDFGFSNLFIPGEQLQTSCGSLAYSAPEILLGDAYDAPAVEANESETLTKILDCKYSAPDHMSSPCKHLISRMLVRDPSKRANLAEVKSSSWVMAGDRGHAELLPLIIRDHLPDCAHTTIVEQMVAGGIGTEEDIICAIEGDEYNYVTATYYLLAERVLSSYREEQAIRLLLQSNAAHATATSDSECRSRSNSWRGLNPRRACTILKEESEEELSTYLRSSRQSSRFYNTQKRELSQSSRPSLAPSRANSNDNFVPNYAILEDEVEADPEEGIFPDAKQTFEFPGDREDSHLSDLHQTHASPYRLLAPISELCDASMRSSAILDQKEAENGLKDDSNLVGSPQTPSGTKDHLPPLPPSSLVSGPSPKVGRSRRYLRNAASLEFPPLEGRKIGPGVLATTPELSEPNSTAPPTPASWTTGDESQHQVHALMRNASLFSSGFIYGNSTKKRRFPPQLLRRNSSPSVSMFGGVQVASGLNSSRERISPQAIQELLEFSRLSGRRAASPDSRISSRSSSPPCSSGRSSPAITGIVARLKASNLIPGSSGMRKLSSSPHLLGICEESEDGTSDSSQNPFCIVRQNKGGGSSLKAGHIGRGTRSASIGLTQMGRSHKSVDNTSLLSTSNLSQSNRFSVSFDSAKPSTPDSSKPIANGLTPGSASKNSSIINYAEVEEYEEDDQVPSNFSNAIRPPSAAGQIVTPVPRRTVSVESSSSHSQL